MEKRYHGTNHIEPIMESGALLCTERIRGEARYQETLDRYNELKNGLGNNLLACSALEERLNVYLGDTLETSEGYAMGDSRTVLEFEIPSELIGVDRFRETLVPGKVDLSHLRKVHTNESNLNYIKGLLKSNGFEDVNVEKI